MKPASSFEDIESASSAAARPASRQHARSTTRTPVSLDEKFDKKLYRPVSYTGGTPAGGDRSHAYVRIPSSSTRVALTPSANGEYPMQDAGLKETVAVRLLLPSVSPGTPVAVTTMDGGTFPAHDPSTAAQMLPVEQWGGIDFRYTTSANTGHHRLRVLPSGGTLRILDFYARPPAK